MEFRTLLIFTVTLGLVSCAAGPCKNEMSNTETNPLRFISKSSPEREVTMAERETPEFQRLFIYKFDGSIQCEPDKKAIPIAKMEEELKAAGIKVFASTSMDGGFMMVQMCGAPTGRIHRFQISKNDLEKAQKLGYKEWVARY
jgi:hypothetical protein